MHETEPTYTLINYQDSQKRILTFSD